MRKNFKGAVWERKRERGGTTEGRGGGGITKITKVEKVITAGKSQVGGGGGGGGGVEAHKRSARRGNITAPR